MQGRLEEAIAAYERALAAAPNLAVVQSNLAVALTDTGTQLKLQGEGKMHLEGPTAWQARQESSKGAL